MQLTLHFVIEIFLTKTVSGMTFFCIRAKFLWASISMASSVDNLESGLKQTGFLQENLTNNSGQSKNNNINEQSDGIS